MRCRRILGVSCTQCWAELIAIGITNNIKYAIIGNVKKLISDFLVLNIRANIASASLLIIRISTRTICTKYFFLRYLFSHNLLLRASAQRQALLASGGGCRFSVRFARARHLSSARIVGQTHDGRTALWASLHFATKRLCFDCFACRDWKYFARAIWNRINTKAKTRTAVLEMVDCTFFTNTIFFHVLPNYVFSGMYIRNLIFRTSSASF